MVTKLGAEEGSSQATTSGGIKSKKQQATTAMPARNINYHNQQSCFHGQI
jgi:hypothetical protein